MGDAVQSDMWTEPVEVQRGDVWQLGTHRLMCGDATNAHDVAMLMQGEKAVLCHADPPYGMGKEKQGIANDNLYGKKLDAFQMQWWRVARPHLTDNASAYIWGNAESLWRLWYQHLVDSERVTFRNEIVWDKQDDTNPTLRINGKTFKGMRSYYNSERCFFFMLGEQEMSTNADNYYEGWEPIRAYLEQERKAMGWDIPTMKRAVGHSDLLRDHWTSKSQWSFPTLGVYQKMQQAAQGQAFKQDYDTLKQDYLSLRAYFDNTHENMTDVWNYPRVKGRERYGHPTPKPVALIERIIKSSSPIDSLIYEPFLGSGTTLVASENTKRRCYGMEIEPHYCSIIIQRWQALTGQRATLLEYGEQAA